MNQLWTILTKESAGSAMSFSWLWSTSRGREARRCSEYRLCLDWSTVEGGESTKPRNNVHRSCVARGESRIPRDLLTDRQMKVIPGWGKRLDRSSELALLKSSGAIGGVGKILYVPGAVDCFTYFRQIEIYFRNRWTSCRKNKYLCSASGQPSCGGEDCSSQQSGAAVVYQESRPSCEAREVNVKFTWGKVRCVCVYVSPTLLFLCRTTSRKKSSVNKLKAS